MQLKLAIHRITTIRFGSRTSLDGTTLLVDAEELRRLLLEDPSLLRVEFEIVQPGESCRVFRIVVVALLVIAAGMISWTPEVSLFEIDISRHCAAICDTRQQCDFFR